MNDVLLEQWSHTATDKGTAIVVPDGCQDVIIKQDKSGHVCYFVTPLTSSAQSVEMSEGSHLLGFRLVPGTTINEEALIAFTQSSSLSSIQNADWLEGFCHLKVSTKEALEGLRSEIEDISALSKSLGVSVRTLQRHVKAETGQHPHFWISLVRARRCARRINHTASLTDVALSCGYSDQAHMTREMRKWFNCTPSAIKKGVLQTAVHLSGYD